MPWPWCPPWTEPIQDRGGSQASGRPVPQGPSPHICCSVPGCGLWRCSGRALVWGQRETEEPGHRVSQGQARGSPEGGADPQPQARERRGPRQRGAPGWGSPLLQDAGLYPRKAPGGRGGGVREQRLEGDLPTGPQPVPRVLLRSGGGEAESSGAQSSNGPLPGCGPRASPRPPPVPFPAALQPGTCHHPGPAQGFPAHPLRPRSAAVKGQVSGFLVSERWAGTWWMSLALMVGPALVLGPWAWSIQALLPWKAVPGRPWLRAASSSPRHASPSLVPLEAHILPASKGPAEFLLGKPGPIRVNPAASWPSMRARSPLSGSAKGQSGYPSCVCSPSLSIFFLLFHQPAEQVHDRIRDDP